MKGLIGGNGFVDSKLPAQNQPRLQPVRASRSGVGWALMGVYDASFVVVDGKFRVISKTTNSLENDANPLSGRRESNSRSQFGKLRDVVCGRICNSWSRV